MATYQRHTPETTVLYQTIARVWPMLSMEYSASDAPIAEHVETLDPVTGEATFFT